MKHFHQCQKCGRQYECWDALHSANTCAGRIRQCAECQGIPRVLNNVVDTVLAYKPAAKTKKAKKRQRSARFCGGYMKTPKELVETLLTWGVSQSQIAVATGASYWTVEKWRSGDTKKPIGPYGRRLVKFYERKKAAREEQP